jgi:ABC-type phosphate/phosphonate transport system permease subunit
MAKIELPEGIFERIMTRIRTERRILTFKRRLAILSVGFVGSSTAFIPAFKLLHSNLVESGFLQFFSLLFSDFGIITGYWKEFSMSLLETLPAASLAIFLAVVFVFLGSLKFLAKDIKLLFSPPKLIIS